MRIHVKFLIKLKNTPTAYYKLLKEAYSENSLFCVFSNSINTFLKAKRAPKMTNVQVDLSLLQLRKQ